MRNLAFGTLATLLLATAVQTATTESAHAQEESAKVRVGVTVSAVINAKPHLGPRVSAALGKIVGETLNADVLAGPEAQARLPDNARSEACLGDSACLVAAGKALGVDQLLMLIIVGVGEELKIEATWVDVATGETALRPGITTADTDDSMRVAFTAKASELLPTIGPRETTTPTVTTPKDPPKNIVEPPTTTPKPVVKKESKSKLPSLLVIGGGAMLGSALAYGGYQWAVDCEFSFGKCQSSDKGGVNTAFDVVGALGTVALSAGLYMVLTADDEEAAPVGFNIGDESFQVTYGGRF